MPTDFLKSLAGTNIAIINHFFQIVTKKIADGSLGIFFSSVSPSTFIRRRDLKEKSSLWPSSQTSVIS